MREFILLTSFLLLLSVPAMAQNTPNAEVFGGYSFVPRAGLEQILHGWNASVNSSVNTWLGIKADFSGHYTTGSVLKVKLYTFTVGPQLTYRRNDKVVPFFHGLFGGGWASAGFPGVDYSRTAFAMNIGGGLDWAAHKNCAVRVIQLDLLVTRFGPDASTDPRISAGIVFRLGSK
jgi:opacity protein-like surface antigen